MQIYSRRIFLKQSTLAAGAGLLCGPATSALYAASQPRKKLGVALVGLGSYATHQLAPALQLTEHCTLTGIVSGTPSKRTAWQAKYNIPPANIYTYENFDAIANNSDIDIVYVVLPNSMHAAYTIRAAEAGKHVICEKPMALNAKECRMMIDACQQNKVSLSIGYRLHFDPYVQEIMRLASEPTMGAVKIVASDFAFVMGNPNQWRLDKALAGGGAVMDIGVYCIQAARYATGEEPIAVRAQEFKTDEVKFAQVDETVTWQLEFPSGAIANSTTSYNGRFNRLFVSYEKRQAKMEPAYSYRGLAGSINGQAMQFPPMNQQAHQMDAVASSILNSAPTPVDGYEGLHDMQIIDALYKSLATGGQRIEISKT